MEVSQEEGTGVVGLLRCLMDVRRPGAVFVQGNSQVLGSVSLLRHVAMDGVLSLDWGPLPRYPEELTLLGMETHEPLLFPSLECIQVRL